MLCFGIRIIQLQDFVARVAYSDVAHSTNNWNKIWYYRLDSMQLLRSNLGKQLQTWNTILLELSKLCLRKTKQITILCVNFFSIFLTRKDKNNSLQTDLFYIVPLS